jgi:replicative DNA helicase
MISNADAEAALVGAMMVDNRLIDRVVDLVRTEDFAEPILGRTFAAIVREHDSGREANPITLRPYFEADPDIAELGGPGFLAQLTGSGFVVIGAVDFARQIAELGRRRRFAERVGFLAQAAGDYDVQAEQLAADTEAAVAELIRSGADGATISAATAIGQALDAMSADAPRGVRCHLIPSLDFVLGAIRPGHLVILAGRPGMCKTATGLTYSHGAAREGDAVLFISLEMRGEELGGRLACDVAFAADHAVPYSFVTDGGASNDQRRTIARAQLEMADFPLEIEDLPSVTIGRLAGIVRRHARRFAVRGKKLKLVVVDYLQLVRPNERAKSRYEEVGQVSRGLKALAKAEDVGVMALCQLSRQSENRPDKRPHLSDLRDSGDIEQDADTVCFVHRPAEYHKREEPTETDSQDWRDWREEHSRVEKQIQFIVAKRRGGRTGVASGTWEGQFQAVRG